MGTVAFNSNNAVDLAKEVTLHLMKTSRPVYNRLTVYVIGHALLCYVITKYQMDNLEFLRLKMLEQQEEEIEYLRQRKNSKSFNNV